MNYEVEGTRDVRAGMLSCSLVFRTTVVVNCSLVHWPNATIKNGLLASLVILADGTLARFGRHQWATVRYYSLQVINAYLSSTVFVIT